MSWDKRGLRVRHPEHGELVTHVSGSCPFIGETRALELISEIETRKLEQLKVNTLEAQMKVLGLKTEITFETKLLEYRRTGRRADPLKAAFCLNTRAGAPAPPPYRLACGSLICRAPSRTPGWKQTFGQVTPLAL